MRMYFPITPAILLTGVLVVIQLGTSIHGTQAMKSAKVFLALALTFSLGQATATTDPINARVAQLIEELADLQRKCSTGCSSEDMARIESIKRLLDDALTEEPKDGGGWD